MDFFIIIMKHNFDGVIRSGKSPATIRDTGLVRSDPNYICPALVINLNMPRGDRCHNILLIHFGPRAGENTVEVVSRCGGSMLEILLKLILRFGKSTRHGWREKTQCNRTVVAIILQFYSTLVYLTRSPAIP